MPKGFKTKEDREKAIVSFVDRMMQSSEEQTMKDRERWQVVDALFKGNMDWGELRASEEWQAKPFLHEFSTIIRNVAASAQDLVFERPDFFTLVSDERDKEFTRILEKVVRYHIRSLDFENAFYEYCLAGGTYGIAIGKLEVEPKLTKRPEVLLPELEKQEQSVKNKLDKSIEVAKDFEIPEDEESITSAIENAISSLFPESKAVTSRAIGPIKRYELGFKYSLVNPFNWYWEPDCMQINESPYTIEKCYKKLFELHDLFKTGVLDKTKRDKIRSSSSFSAKGGMHLYGTYEGQKWNQRNQQDDKTEYTPIVELVEYYGPFLDEQGEVIEEDMHFIVGNRSVVLKDQKNQNWKQDNPYFVSVFSKSLFKAVGQGIADNAVDQQLIINDLFGKFVDLMTLAVYTPKAFDSSKLADPSQLEGGVEPGQLIDTYGSDAREVFSDIPVNVNVAPHLFQTLEALRLSGEKGASVDTQSANPASRARITRAEIEANLSRTTRSLFALGRELDAHCIRPLVMRVFDLVLQFGFTKDALEDLHVKGELSKAEFDLVANIPAIERFREITRSYRVDIKGFRERLERNDYLSRVIEFLQQINQMPESRGSIDFKYLLGKVSEAYGFDTDKLLVQNSPQDKAREENNLLNNDQTLSVGDQDQDGLELPVHYEQLLKNPNQSTVAHIQGHMQRIQLQGGQLPPPPPEVAQLLGIQPAGEQGPPIITAGGNGLVQ